LRRRGIVFNYAGAANFNAILMQFECLGKNFMLNVSSRKNNQRSSTIILHLMSDKLLFLLAYQI